MNETKPTVASKRESRVTEATRIPMSVPRQKLAVPDIPGYHLHWFLGMNTHRALQAGYTFVDPEVDDVDIMPAGLADPTTAPGSTDLGSRVSIVAGAPNEGDLDAPRLYLMKIPEEWWQDDQKSLQERNDAIAQQLRGGTMGAEQESGGDRSKRYLKTGQDLFVPKTPKPTR